MWVVIPKSLEQFGIRAWFGREVFPPLGLRGPQNSLHPYIKNIPTFRTSLQWCSKCSTNTPWPTNCSSSDKPRYFWSVLWKVLHFHLLQKKNSFGAGLTLISIFILEVEVLPALFWWIFWFLFVKHNIPTRVCLLRGFYLHNTMRSLHKKLTTPAKLYSAIFVTAF